MTHHASLKPSLVNLISKDVNLVFHLSVYPSILYQICDYDVNINFCFESPTSFKTCHVDLIKITAVGWTTFISATCINAANRRGI